MSQLLIVLFLATIMYIIAVLVATLLEHIRKHKPSEMEREEGILALDARR